MIYFIHGPDRLLAREAALAIAADLDPDGSNTTWLDGRETSFAGVESAIGAASFFGSPRIVIVMDLLARASRDSDDAESPGGDEDRPSRVRAELESLISAVPESHHLLLLEPSLTSVPAGLKASSRTVKVIAGEPPRGPALLAWIDATVLQAESHIDRRAAQRLAETLYPQSWDRKSNNPRYDRPPDLALLRAEIQKLALAAHPGPINVDHIAALTPGGPDQRVFRFLDAALAGDLRSGLNELERLHASGEEPAMLFAQLLGQLELTTVIGAAGSKSAEAVARDLGTVPAGRLSAVMATTRRRAPQVAAAGIGVHADRSLKTGRVRRPEDALHDLILALGSSAPGESTGGSA